MRRDLPCEILLIVFELVQRPMDLLNLIRCSRTFRAIAEPILYRHINIRSFPRRARRLFETLVSRPDLTVYVRSLCSDGGLICSDAMESMEESSETSLLQERVLAQACNLGTLDLSINPNPKSINALHSTRLAPRLPISRLAHLVVSFHLPQDQLEELIALLRSQKSLKHLELPTVSSLPSGLQEGDLPVLETFIGQMSVGEALARGRPLRRVVLAGGVDGSSTEVAMANAIASLGRSTASGGVKEMQLKIVLRTPWPTSLLEHVAEHAPRLRFLSLHVSYMAENAIVVDGNLALFRQFFESIPLYLSRCRFLELLDLDQCSAFVHRPSISSRPGFIHFTGDADIDSEEKRLISWSSVCPTLCHVVMPNGHVWRRPASRRGGIKRWSGWTLDPAKEVLGPVNPTDPWRDRLFTVDLR
ncbi:hypothetical protein FRC03_010940 [Tulasnella sp. 419]|nr:hypothetical protein FRC02_011006 [Tulasnella sp. 418]KAG8966985.1 hypothetical protein FRC03_010940 [Tulasnella sp. 419]